MLYGIDRLTSRDDKVQDTQRTGRSVKDDVRHPDVLDRLRINQQDLLAN